MKKTKFKDLRTTHWQSVINECAKKEEKGTPKTFTDIDIKKMLDNADAVP